MRKTPASSSQRYPWVASAAWGWRLEIGTVVIGLIVLLIASAVNRAGPFVAVPIGSLLLWKCPQIRHQFNARRTVIKHISRLERALWHCAIVGRHGDIPRVARKAPLPVGMRYLIRLPFGLHFEIIESRAPEIAAALGARTVQVKTVPQSANYVQREPLAVPSSN